MDPRIQAQQRLGSSPGEAFILRNAGGRVTEDVIRGLVLCTRLMNVADIGVIHHTGCRLQGLTNHELARRTGVDVDFLPFLDSASTVADDVGRLRASGLFGADVSIWGGLYCVDSHRTTVLVPPASAKLSVTSRDGPVAPRGDNEDHPWAAAATVGVRGGQWRDGLQRPGAWASNRVDRNCGKISLVGIA